MLFIQSVRFGPVRPVPGGSVGLGFIYGTVKERTGHVHVLVRHHWGEWGWDCRKLERNLRGYPRVIYHLSAVLVKISSHDRVPAAPREAGARH